MNSFDKFEDSKTEKSKSKEKKSSAGAAKEIAIEKKAEAPKPKSLAELFKIADKTDKSEVGETESKDLGELDLSEEKAAAVQIVDHQKENVAAEESETIEGTPEAAEVAADQALLDELILQLDDESASFDEALENAGQKVMAELKPEESEIEDAEEDDPATLPPPAKGPPTPPAVPPIPPAGAGTGGNLPPTPPLPPHGPNFVPNPGSGAGSNPNVQPASPNVDPRFHHNRGPDLLIGGVIGYLIGRRRGRIKTEEKLLPIQAKLEEKVVDLQAQIVRKEEQVRTLAREKYWAAKPEARPAMIEKMQKRHKEAEAEAIKLPERNPEKLGKIIVETAAERAVSRPENLPKIAEKMTHTELLVAAERIEVNNVTLRRMYETHALDEEGLRKVVEAYARGDQYKEVLAREIIGQETRIEKSIERDKDASFRANNQGGQAQQADHQEYGTSGVRRLEDDEMPMPAAKPKKNSEVGQMLRHNPKIWITIVVAIAVIITLIVLQQR